MEIARAIDAERRRIAQILHDRTGADLAAAAITLQTIDNRLQAQRAGLAQSEIHTLLGEAQDLLANAIAQMRDLCVELRPAPLDSIGLVPVLTAELERFGRRTGVKVAFVARLARPGQPENRLPAAYEWLIYRVAQEAMSNCARHAQARHLALDLARDSDGGVRLSIHDDGVGFDVAVLGKNSPGDGTGLATMRDRVEGAGGRYAVQSGRGTGTRIDIRLPPQRAA